jgi:NitT/TauT family transport system ATP-binding protein
MDISTPARPEPVRTPPAIAFSKVGLELGGSRIYDDLTFQVEQGEFVCLLGPSGCGKSTALRLVGDLLDVKEGQVTLGGDRPADAWARTAFVFQNPRLLPWRNTLENAAFGLELRHPEMPKAQRLEIASRELSHVGLAGDRHKMPVMLSGGEKQRVAIARALALDPQIILMDEPFSALDHATRARLRRQIVDLWRETGKTVLFVTHDIDEALVLADRIVVLSRKPTRVAEIVEVREPRPREIEESQPLQDLRVRLIDLFDRISKA